MILGIMQPINALLRPHLTDIKSKNRQTWETLHHTAGYLALFGGFVNTCLGLKILSPEVVDGGDQDDPFYNLFVGLRTAFIAAVVALLGGALRFLNIKDSGDKSSSPESTFVEKNDGML